jgi:glycerophosphoryl diester phosphodiesterase
VGAEVLFDTEDSEFATEAYVERMHKAGLLVWVNAIVYNHKAVLTAGHNDDISVVGRMDEGWGWLLDKGYDIIQTDWPMMLKQYISQRNAR